MHIIDVDSRLIISILMTDVFIECSSSPNGRILASELHTTTTMLMNIAAVSAGITSMLLFILLHAISITATPKDNSTCKCLPNTPCWPSFAEWQRLNSSIGGSLIDVRPIASACYEGLPEFDSNRCREVERFFSNSSWRADQAGEFAILKTLG